MNMRQNRRVVVTGIGAVTPAGLTLAETWNTILAGKSAGDWTQLYDARKMPSPISYEVKGFEFDPQLARSEELPYLTRASKLALTALRDALESAGMAEGSDDPENTMVCFGAGIPSTSFDWFSSVFVDQRFDDESMVYHMRNFPFVLSSIIGRTAKARGGNFTVHTACASSGQALGEAFELIKTGEAEIVVTGGADSMITPVHMAGFCLLGALATEFGDDPRSASRPFDMKRNGFVMGEGACVLIFEEYERARARGAAILGEVVGYGCTESAYRITDLHPEGLGPIEAMEMAIAEAGVPKSAIGYINAHGTSTKLNDQVEALSISKVFGEGSDVHVSSTKSVTGHLISAAGALEFAVCIKALQDQTLPPSVNLEQQDPECNIRLSPTIVTKKEMEYALSNSIGFGGSNTALIARRTAQ